MIKRYTSNIYFDFYLNAAEELNIKYQILPNHRTTALFRKNDKSLFISNAVLGTNNSLSVKLTRNKYTTYILFNLKNIPHPKAIKITSSDKIMSKIKILKKPLVVKPTCGFGGYGVTVKIKKFKDLKKAIRSAKKYNKEIIIEEFIKGENYRILVFKNQILDIVKRIPANLKGNGTDTIETLIYKKNQKRMKVGLKKIKIDNELNKEIKENRLSSESVLNKNELIYLRKNCNMATGGETERIPIKKVSDDNKILFLQAVKLLNLDFAGIDFITTDITKSYKSNSSMINEVNRCPSLDVHYFADMKMNNSFAEKILSMYFNC